MMAFGSGWAFGSFTRLSKTCLFVLYDTTLELRDFFDLQKIFKYDERFLKYKKKLERLTKLFHKMMEFQYDDKESEITKAIQPELIDSLDLCDNEEELNDYYEFFQLYFGKI